jgi:hypothetical protein
MVNILPIYGVMKLLLDTSKVWKISGPFQAVALVTSIDVTTLASCLKFWVK